MTHGRDTSVALRILSGHAAHGHDTYSCEKAFRRLSGTEILP